MRNLKILSILSSCLKFISKIFNNQFFQKYLTINFVLNFP